MITKPMLASACEDASLLRFPVLATPKLDGIRCLLLTPSESDPFAPPRAVSRNFKPIQNHFIRAWLEANCYAGFDGELMLRDSEATFQQITSAVMGHDGEPDFVYQVFDFFGEDLKQAYVDRMVRLKQAPTLERVIKVLPKLINNLTELLAYEEAQLTAGYEGVMVRALDSPYKCGRSSVKEGYLLKIKRFQDDEAHIIGLVEKMHNGNEAEKDAFGRTKRSTKKEGKTPLGTLGALEVKDIKTGVEFEIGTGFDDAMRAIIWERGLNNHGKIVKYKHQPSGAKDKPRFPVFLGFRDAADTDATVAS